MGYEFTQTTALLQRNSMLAMLGLSKVASRRRLLQRPAIPEWSKGAMQSMPQGMCDTNTRPRTAPEKSAGICASTSECKSKQVSKAMAGSIKAKKKESQNCGQGNLERGRPVWDSCQARTLHAMPHESARPRTSRRLHKALGSRMVVLPMPCKGPHKKLMPWCWRQTLEKVEGDADAED